MSVAHLTITARLSRDPELRTTKGGKSVCTLTLPVDSGYGDNKTTTWWTASLWGKSAETASQHLRKGSWVCVSGEARIRTYTKSDGDTGFSAEVNANGFTFVGNKGDSEPAPQQRRTPGRYSVPADVNDGSIPF